MSTMKAYCSECGSEVDPEAFVCANCRRPLKSLVVRAAGPEPVDDGPDSGGQSGAGSLRYPATEQVRRPPERGRSAAWAAVIGTGLLGFLLLVFVIAHAAGSQPGGSTASQVPTNVPLTPAPSSATTAQPTPSAQVGAAHFVRVASDIPGGHCTTRQGCPVTGTFKNTGGRGGGSVTFSLVDSGGNVVGTYTAQLPVTDPGASQDVSGYATGDQLPAYLKSGGTVQLQVSVTNA